MFFTYVLPRGIVPKAACRGDLPRLRFFPENIKKTVDISVLLCYTHQVSKRYGGIPERPKGADCKSVVHDFAGSNPASPTRLIV